MAERDHQVQGYARALFSVAEAEGALDDVEDELFRFSATLQQQGELREALTDLALPFERKRAMLEELLSDRASRHTVALLTFVVEQGRARELPAIVDRLVELASERRQREVAEVRVAVELDEQQRTRLAEALARATGKRVELKVVHDPSVVGGVFARVGDQVIDGTVRNRLTQARELLSEV